MSSITWGTVFEFIPHYVNSERGKLQYDRHFKVSFKLFMVSHIPSLRMILVYWLCLWVPNYRLCLIIKESLQLLKDFYSFALSQGQNTRTLKSGN